MTHASLVVMGYRLAGELSPTHRLSDSPGIGESVRLANLRDVAEWAEPYTSDRNCSAHTVAAVFVAAATECLPRSVQAGVCVAECHPDIHVHCVCASESPVLLGWIRWVVPLVGSCEALVEDRRPVLAAQSLFAM